MAPTGKFSLSIPFKLSKLKQMMTRTKRAKKSGRTPKGASTPVAKKNSEDPPVLQDSHEVLHQWDEAVKHYGGDLGNVPKEELRTLVYAGIPMKYRKSLWHEWGSHQLRGDSNKLLPLASEEAAMRIAKDVPRTQTWFDDVQRSTLRRLLLAHAAQSPAVGYCQGMNFIAGTLVALGFDEASAFDIFCHIEETLCDGYHSSDLGGFHQDVSVLEDLVFRFLPSAHAMLTSAGVPLVLLAIDHFITLTSRTWALEATARLWDALLWEGRPVLFASFLAVLDLHLSVPMDDKHGSFEVLESFKHASAKGAAEHLDELMERTRYFVDLIPDSLLEELHASHVEA